METGEWQETTDLSSMLMNLSGQKSNELVMPGKEEDFYRRLPGLLRYASGPLPKMGALVPIIRNAEEIFGLFGVKALCLSSEGNKSSEGDKLEFLPQWHFDELPADAGSGAYVPVAGSIGGLAVEAGKTVHIYDVLTSDRWMETDWSLDKLIGSLISTPIFLEDTMWGVLCGFTKSPRHFSDDEFASFESIARLAGIIIERVTSKNHMEQLFLNTATMSHDARNALLPISFAVRAMEKKHGESISEGAAEYLDVITTASKTTGEILRSWKNSIGEIPSDFGDCDLLEELRSGIAMFSIQAEGRNIKLELKDSQAESGGPPGEIRIKVSHADLDRVIQGYISNAIKYCGQLVQVEVINEEGTGEAGFRVNDDGEGIALEFRDQVFDSFFQLPGSHPGEGLGLAGVRFIVERNGGRFGVDQAPGGGSSFWAVFPKVK